MLLQRVATRACHTVAAGSLRAAKNTQPVTAPLRSLVHLPPQGKGPGKKGKKKQAAKAVVEAEVAAFKDVLASGGGGEEGGKQKKGKKHKLVAF